MKVKGNFFSKALLFFIPGLGETLRVNGKVTITKDDELLEMMAVNGKFYIGRLKNFLDKETIKLAGENRN